MDQPQRHGDTELDEINNITERIIGCAIVGWASTVSTSFVENLVIVEIKSVERMNPIFETHVLTYLRVSKKRVGLLINLSSRLVRDGVKRLIVCRPTLRVSVANSSRCPL